MRMEDCVICCSYTYKPLVTALGARYTPVTDSYCTHVLAREVPRDTQYPETPVVHPEWLWESYWRPDFCAAPVEPYLIDFYLEARRMDTETTLGTRELFYQEMPRMQAVLACTRNWLDDQGPHWPFVCRQLQNTAFWGPRVRQLNWARRWPLLAHGLRGRVGPLPPELWRAVVQFF